MSGMIEFCFTMAAFILAVELNRYEIISYTGDWTHQEQSRLKSAVSVCTTLKQLWVRARESMVLDILELLMGSNSSLESVNVEDREGDLLLWMSIKGKHRDSLHILLHGDGMLLPILKSLVCNTTLRELDIMSPVSRYRDLSRPSADTLAEIIRKNPRFDTLLLDRFTCDIYTTGAIYEAILDTPRRAPPFILTDFCVYLNTIVGDDTQDNEDIITQMVEGWEAKMLAFAMAMHPRLGREAPIGSLDKDVFGMIADAFWAQS